MSSAGSSTGPRIRDDVGVTELSVQGLYKAFGRHPVLAGLDLTVPAGSLTAILGPSGSGKTTLLRVLAGFDQPDAGTVSIGDQLVDGPGAHVPPEHRRIGYVPQEGSLFPHLSVAANVAFGLPAGQRRGPRTDELLESVGLAGLGRRYPHQLSGGQQQRVALARALAIQPALVLLDEPFAALDAHLRASVRTDVQQIFRARGTTAILVTHDQDEALSMADRVAVLRDGRIAQYAAPQDLYLSPADPELAGFIGDANLLDGLLLAGGDARPAPAVRTVFGELGLAATAGSGLAPGPVTVLVRPEQLEIAAAAERPAGDAACVAGQVVACHYYGHDAVLRVRLTAEAAGPEIIVRTAGGPQLAAGTAVVVRATGPVLAWPRS
jgi:iron(III) transport system ATP-binding protein